MRLFPILLHAAFACGVALVLCPSACGGASSQTGFSSGSSGGSSGAGSSGSGASGSGGSSGGADDSGASNGSGFGSFGDGSTAPPPTPVVSGDGGVACPPGLMCDYPCGEAGTATTITGKVYDPAGKNPLYNVAVYIPVTQLQPLPKGVPTGADACSCPALFKSGALAATSTAVDGTFTLKDVPVGDVTLVLQVGKWRRAVNVTTKACQANAQPDKSLTLPGTLAGAGPYDNMPDIAVSTGSADSLECLLTRIGVPGSEYVAGSATTGHVHIFSGGNALDSVFPGGGFPLGGGGLVPGGIAETNPMPGAPASPTALWASQDQLMPYDITLLSCEGDETYNANPAALEAYLNAGGRAFASHYHYSFFSGPISSGQAYRAPADWGSNLANWSMDVMDGNGPIGGLIQTTLNGSAMPFAKGVALNAWLKIVNALGTDQVPAADLAIYQPRYNAVVVPTDKPSQPWIASDPAAAGGGGSGGGTGRGGGGGGAPANGTLYFSFDTPVAGPNYCGRAVFSDLHVSGNPLIHDTCNLPLLGSLPPGGCDSGKDLTPQEKALEFMLFDLSSCVISDTIAPTPIPTMPAQ